MGVRAASGRERARALAAIALLATSLVACGSDAPRSAATTLPPVTTASRPTSPVAVPITAPAAALTSTVVVTLPPTTAAVGSTQPAVTLPPTTVPLTTAAASTAPTNVELTVATVTPPSAGTTAPAAAPTPTTSSAPIVVDGLALAPCIDADHFEVDQRAPRGQVALFQYTLDRLGYDPGDIDGYFGPNTMQAGAEEILDHSPQSGRELFLDDGVIAIPAFRRLGIACPGGVNVSDRRGSAPPVLELRLAVVAVHQGDEVDRDLLRARRLALAVVRARAEVLVHRLDHRLDPPEPLGLTLRQQVEVGDLRAR